MTARRRESEWTDVEFRKEATSNHIWINAFSTIRPTDEFLADIGRAVIRMVNQSEMGTDFTNGPMAVITVNIS
jgi:hypothetical protein